MKPIYDLYKYAGDYSLLFDANTLITKQYVDDAIGNIPSELTADNGIAINGSDVIQLGGLLTQ